MISSRAVCVAPVLAVDVRNQIRALTEAGALRELIGGAVFHGAGKFGKCLRTAGYHARPERLAKSESRRLDTEAAPDVCRSIFWPELTHRFAVRCRLRTPGPRATDAWFSAVDRAAARHIRAGDTLVLAREDACLRSFAAAHRVGATTLYDLPIPHHSAMRRCLEIEAEQFPDAGSEFDPAEEYRPGRTRRKDAELASADAILVASDFVRDGLIEQGIAADRIRKIPYGCEADRPFIPFRDRKPVVLYVGHLSLRKGVARLLRVWKRLGAHRTHTLRLVGKKLLSDRFLAEYSGLFEYVPPVPRSRLWVQYSEARVFVFPSACDGFGLVLNESLSSGTPVIASSHTGAPGFIDDGRQGRIYRHGDDDALAAHLERALSKPVETAEMGREAHEFARRWGWADYRAQLRELAIRLSR